MKFHIFITGFRHGTMNLDKKLPHLIKLYPDGKIELNYSDISGPFSPTIGIQNIDATDAVLIAVYQNQIYRLPCQRRLKFFPFVPIVVIKSDILHFIIIRFPRYILKCQNTCYFIS